jgi:hypothetical protein
MSDLELTDAYDPDAFEKGPRAPVTPRAVPPARPAEPAMGAPPSSPGPAEAPVEQADESPVPWKAAASSVPKLRQQPVSYEPADREGSFQGFAQDAVPARGPAGTREFQPLETEAGPDDGPGAPAMPLAVAPPFWDVWLERARALPTPVVLGACGVLVLGVVLMFALRPGEQPSVSLSRIRQHPEAFDGQRVAVRGKAGETFQIGGSYVFDLRQGRDTIVVYSRTQRPSLHQEVLATGRLSIGYLDGAPRLALFEEPPIP